VFRFRCSWRRWWVAIKFFPEPGDTRRIVGHVLVTIPFAAFSYVGVLSAFALPWVGPSGAVRFLIFVVFMCAMYTFASEIRVGYRLFRRSSALRAGARPVYRFRLTPKGWTLHGYCGPFRYEWTGDLAATHGDGLTVLDGGETLLDHVKLDPFGSTLVNGSGPVTHEAVAEAIQLLDSADANERADILRHLKICGTVADK
jgi:hypothetical protein